MESSKRVNLRSVALIAVEAVALLGDAVLAHGTFEKALDSSSLALVLAALAAVLIFMAGEFAGRALFRGTRGVAGAAFVMGFVVVIGVGVVRGLFGLGGGGGAATGVAAQIDTTEADNMGNIVLALIVSTLMLGVLALGTWASRERAEERADRLASEIAVMKHRAFGLAQERTFLLNDLAAARVALRTAVEDIAAQVIACSLPQAINDAAADVIVDETPIGAILADAPGAGTTALERDEAPTCPAALHAHAAPATAATEPAPAFSLVEAAPAPQSA